MASASNKAGGDGVNLEAEKLRRDLRRHNHRYNIMMRDKISFKKKMEMRLEKQKNMLEKYEVDRRNLISTTLCTDQDIKKMKIFYQDFIIFMQEKAYLEDEIKTIKSEIEGLVIANSKLVKNIKIKEAEKYALRRKYLGNVRNPDAMISTMESRYSQIQNALNETLKTVSDYRKEIDQLLGERSRFTRLVESIVYKLSEGKACMLDLFEQASIAFFQREERMKELISLEKEHKRKTNKDATQYRALANAVAIKNDSAVFQSVKMQRRICKGIEANRVMTELIQRQDCESTIRLNKLIIFQLLEFYKVKDIIQAAQQFNNTELNNWSIFHYTNWAFNETCQCKNSINLFEYQMTIIHEVNIHILMEEKQNRDNALAQYESLTKELERRQVQLNYARGMVRFCVSRLNKLYNEANCSPRRYKKSLVGHEVYSEQNVRVLLKEVERALVILIGLLYKIESERSNPHLNLHRHILVLPKGYKKNGAVIDFGSNIKSPCPACTYHQICLSKSPQPSTIHEIEENVKKNLNTKLMRGRLHSMSQCMLPASRLLQKNFLKPA